MRRLLSGIQLNELIRLLSGTEVNEVVARAVPIHVCHPARVEWLRISLQMQIKVCIIGSLLFCAC